MRGQKARISATLRRLDRLGTETMHADDARLLAADDLLEKLLAQRLAGVYTIPRDLRDLTLNFLAREMLQPPDWILRFFNVIHEGRKKRGVPTDASVSLLDAFEETRGFSERLQRQWLNRLGVPSRGEFRQRLPHALRLMVRASTSYRGPQGLMRVSARLLISELEERGRAGRTASGAAKARGELRDLYRLAEASLRHKEPRDADYLRGQISRFENAIRTARECAHRPKLVEAKAKELLPDVPLDLMKLAGVAEDKAGIWHPERAVAFRLLAALVHMSPSYLERELRPDRARKPSLAESLLLDRTNPSASEA
jgi:hypothetical protein